VELPLAKPQMPFRPAHEKFILLCCADERVPLISNTLADVGLRCTVVTDEPSARREIAKGVYVAALVDIALPEGAGISLVRALRSERATADLPVLLLGPASQSCALESMPDILPVVDWLDRPLDRERLIHVLRHALSAYRARRPRLLHVDDDPDVLTLVKVAFQEAADVWSAATLNEAEKILAIWEPDLVILDLTLAEGSALELLPKLRQHNGQIRRGGADGRR
jgi:CheY-like chemotaxis protein